MLSEAIREQYICDELQCPGHLNRLISNGQRAEFHLLLNLFSQDVSQQAQFSLGSLESEALVSTPVNGDLRKRFDLPEQALISANTASSGYSNKLNNILANEGGIAMHLALSQKPEALACRNNPKYIETEILQQLDAASQLRYLEKHPKPQDKPETVTMYQVLTEFDYDKEIKVTHYS